MSALKRDLELLENGHDSSVLGLVPGPWALDGMSELYPIDAAQVTGHESMHLFLEGVTKDACYLMLWYMINSAKHPNFTEDSLYSAMRSYPYLNESSGSAAKPFKAGLFSGNYPDRD